VRDWTAEELDRIGAADELEIAALRPDGALRPFTTIWVVRVGDERTDPRRHFREPDDADHDAIDRVYQDKYARYGSSYVHPMVSPDATAATLRLIVR
jgi:hypothetical protein